MKYFKDLPIQLPYLFQLKLILILFPDENNPLLSFWVTMTEEPFHRTTQSAQVNAFRGCGQGGGGQRVLFLRLWKC